MNPGFETGDWNRFVSHYIITNSNGSGNLEPGEVGDWKNSWNTAAADEQGESLYQTTCTLSGFFAWDYAGNVSVAESTVLVDNN